MKKLDAYKLININAGLLLLVGMLSMALLMSGNSYADDSHVSTATIRVAESCSITSTLDTPHIALLPAGIYSGNYNSDGHDYRNGIGKTTIKAFCNDSAGFSIYAIGYTNDTFGNNTLIGPDNNTIVTGTGTSGETSNWAMKIGTVAGTYAPTLENGYGSFKAVPSTYDKVASFNSVTDLTNGSSITTTYAAYIASTQAPGTYNGKVKYTLVHPVDEAPLQPETTDPGKICYYANARTYEGTMGCQTVSTSATSATLLADNFSRSGYGFAGWSNKFDYATNPNQEGIKFYGPQETITFTAGQYSGTNNGLSLYAVWIKSAGSLQDSTKVAELCGTGANALTQAPIDGTANLSSVSALTDERDSQTYAIAKLADGKCWMIENLRLADKDSSNNDIDLSSTNTNNPSLPITNVYDATNPTTSNHLSPSVNPTTTAWCTSSSSACDDQSMLNTDNYTNRASSPATNTGINMYSYGAYYNWYSATAGHGKYGSSYGSDYTAPGDICPTGWNLPTSGSTDKDFAVLYTTLNSTAANIRRYPNNFLYSGRVYGSSVNDKGSLGLYWSKSAGNSDSAYSLYFASSYVGSSGRNDKVYGFSVRCLAQ